jgi:hypothetical protein
LREELFTETLERLHANDQADARHAGHHTE